MIRQRQRKTVEELYSSKFDASKSHVTAMKENSGQKTNRAVERDNGYNNMSCNSAVTAVEKSVNSGKETSRRKCTKATNKKLNENQCAKEIYTHDSGKRTTINPMKTENFAVYNKEIWNDDGPETQSQLHQHQQQHQHRHRKHRAQVEDEDVDDETDEFFELIRRTVENAIARSVPDLLNRKFRELSSKLDSFSGELKNTNGLLGQLQNEMADKIGHYGEENSQHFRYLCMKSEYDKMFYQHQAFVAASKPANADNFTETTNPEIRKRFPKSTENTTKIQRQENENTNKQDACPCLSKKCKSPTPASKTRQDSVPSFESISQKSSEIGMQEVLEQIKHFCTLKQCNYLERVPSSDDGPGTSQQRNAMMRPEKFIQVSKEVFEDEEEADNDDDWEKSSDGMTPRNQRASNDMRNKYGGTTSRGSLTQRGNDGAGDG